MTNRGKWFFSLLFCLGSLFVTAGDLTKVYGETEAISLQAKARTWSGGYVCNITIKNNTNQKFDNWKLVLNKSNFIITSAWNAALSSDNGYQLTPESYNQSIAPNGTVTIGVRGAGPYNSGFDYTLSYCVDGTWYGETNVPATESSSPTLSSNLVGASAYNLVVAKDGSGNYTTVQAAINAVPNNNSKWFKIYIKNGTYREVIKVSQSKTYVRLIGQSTSGTKLTYSNCSSTAGGTGNSASVFLLAKNFIAENLTFENAFDYDHSTVSNKQAVAAEAMADRQIFVNCRFTGYQDTLLVNNGRQYFKNCYIQGHTDFIFGDATAVFDNCTIYSLYKPGGCITAPSTYASTAYGLVFLNCQVTGDSKMGSNTVYLGRPWHPGGTSSVKSSATFLYCNLGAHIQNNGWTSMSGVYPSTERLYEYKNTGTGAKVNSSRRQLSDSTAKNYTVKNILKGSDGWDPTILP